MGVAVVIGSNGPQGTDRHAEAAIRTVFANFWENFANRLVFAVFFLGHHVRAIGNIAFYMDWRCVAVVRNLTCCSLRKSPGVI